MATNVKYNQPHYKEEDFVTLFVLGIHRKYMYMFFVTKKDNIHLGIAMKNASFLIFSVYAAWNINIQGVSS